MSEGWRDYHSRWEGVHWLSRAMEHWGFYAKFHSRIRRFLRPGDSLLEVGSGKGYSALYFAAQGFRVTGLDPDVPSVVEASDWAARLALPARFAACDFRAFRPAGRFRMSYSMGLIEHFPPEEARSLLGFQREVSDLVVALAPTRHSLRTVEPCSVPWTPQSLRSLRRTFRSAGLEVLASFGAGDVHSPWDARFKAILPHAALHFLQNRVSYAMNVCLVARGGARPAA